MKRKESGITLLSLCIALIVMIILAGIALRLGVGDQGIVGMTTNTVEQYTNATDQEQEGLNRFVDEFNSIINGGETTGDSGDEDITLSARPTINVSGWNNQKATVEISTQAGYTTEYKIGRTGPWQTYTGQFSVDNGTTVYARYKDDTGVGPTVSKIVEDTTGPEVQITDLQVNGGEITISVIATDTEIGMPDPPTYNYYIKPQGEQYYESVGHNTTGEFTFTDLQGNTSYDIRVSTTDLAGNQGSITANSQTGSVVTVPNLVKDQNIFFDLNPSGPTQDNVDVTIRVEPELEEPLKLQYSVNGTDNWKDYDGPVEMTDNGRVYARVTDGTEFSNVVYVDVTNIDRTKPDVSADVTGTTSDSITVEVTPNDPSDPDKDDFTYDYYIKEHDAPDSEYKKDNGENNKDGSHIFEGLDQDKDYDIKIEVTDPAGNTTEITITEGAHTGTVPSAEPEDGNMTLSSNPTTPTNQNVTVTITDNLNEGYSIQYSITYVGQSEGPAQDYTGPFEVTDNCTVKAWFTDGTNAGDPATLEIANIDRHAPVASADPASEEDKSQQKTVTVKVTENGSAGFNANQGLNYAWTQSNSTAPEGLTSLPGENADKANEISFTVPSGTGLNGTYYLYVAPVPDKAGNQSEAHFFGPYVFDSSVPRPEFGGDEPGDDYKKEYETEITFPDGDGDEVTDIEYVWTHDKEKPDFDDEDTHPTTAEKGEDGSTTIPSPPGETGDDWYLHVKIEDDEGNEEIITKGPYKLDNEGPTVDFGDYNYTDYKKEHTITVTVDDNDRSGPNEDSFKYLWVKGDGTPTDDDIKNNGESFNNGEGIKTPSNATGDDYYLWVYVEDNLGNSTKDKIGPVYVDNTAPTATFSPDGSTTWQKSHNVTVTPADGNSGVNGETIKYQWTQSSTAPDENDIKTNGTKFTLGEDGTATIPSPSNATGNNWYLWIYEEDNAGNSSIVGTKNPFYLDNTAPSLDLSVIGEPSSNTINIKATATDADSQIDSTSYTYYIKETNGGNYGEAIKDGDSHRFTGLKQDTSYTILVEVTDNAGNKISKETTVITGSVAGGDSVIDHTLSDDGWTNKPVDVTLDVSDEYPDYTIEYKEPGDNNWKKYPPETGKITVDKNEDIIVRPVDPSGNPGSESTIQITNIDTVAPTISAKPSEEETPSKSKTITVTATDTNTDENIAGFAEGVQIKYGWSTSSSTAPSYDQTATSNNGQDATTANFSVTTPNVTGTYYLWVQAGSLQDQAGNPNAEAHFGPYVFDNQGPSINFTQNEGTNWAKSHTTSVTSDDTNAQITYVWKLASEGEPRDDEYTGTTTSGADITKNSDSGEYILYVKATDSLGNETKAQSGIFRFDNIAPEVTFGTDGDSTPRKEHSTTVNVSNDGLSNIVTRKYLWSTQTSGINEGSFASVSDTFASGETVRGSGYNESYYLWVYVADAAGNIVVTKTNNSFNFDNTLPKITFTPEQNTTPAKSQSTKVSVSDTNLDESSLKYLWTQNDTKPDASQITNPLKNNSDVTLNGETGNRYLWVLALDTANNQVIEGAGPFLLDNTPPSIELDYDGTTNSITVNVTAQDDYSGVASYSYTIQQVGGSYTQTVSGGASHTFEELPSNTTYNITVTVTDGSGNSDSRSLNGIITASIPGGSSAINASINPESWTNTPVTVTLTNNAQNPQNYKIVYKIGQDGIETDYSVPFTVSTNSTVYAWLEDTAGNQGSPAVIDISKIDTKAPTVSAQPSSDGAASQTKRVTVTATDTNYDSNVAGFKANQSLKYAWSTSNTEVPSSFNTATGTNTAGARSISFNVTGEGLTGNYYLWVQAGSFADQANNSNAQAVFGPYNFDNEAPKMEFGPNGSDDYEKHYDVEVKFPDGDQGQIDNIEYVWTKGTDTTPDFDKDGKPVVIGGGEDGKTIIPSPDDATGNDWYLNVKVTDEFGNEETVKVGPFYIDNSGPTITKPTGDYSTPQQSHTVTVKVEDTDSGMPGNMPKYVWVNGDGTPTEDELKAGTTFTSESPITTPSGENGNNWHLWIYAEDNLGNSSTENIGPFNIDNTAPSITFTPNGNTGSWQQSYSVKVDAADSNAGVKADTLKYQWTQSSSAPSAESFNTNGTSFTSGSNISSPADVTGNNWYLWIYAQDNAGNSNIVGTTKPFYIDNTDPNLSLEVIGTATSNTINIQANATDGDSGINDSSYRYYIKETHGGNYGSAETDGKTHRFEDLEQNTEYTIMVEVADNAGNTISKEITVTTGSVASGEDAIDHQINPKDWTNSSVTLTLGLKQGYDGYKIQYSESASGPWTDYDLSGSGITVDTNKTIYAQLLDISGNAGAVVPIQISTIDTVAPTVSAKPSSQDPADTQVSITVTAEDSNYDSNVAGFAAGQTLRYGWSTSSTEEPAYDQKATSSNSAGATTMTFRVTTPANVTGDYYLWILNDSVVDRAGNKATITPFGPYKLDNEAPSITFSPNGDSNYAKSHSVTVNAGDATVRKYVWTQDTEEPSSDKFTGTFDNDVAINKRSDSGDWYLWVYVEDSLGNSATSHSNVFKFDNTLPNVTFETDGSNTPAKSHSTVVNIANDGYSSIDKSSLKYLWNTSSSGITESSFSSVSSTYTNGGSVTGSGYNGNYYLWVIAKDTAGNTTVKRTTNSFNFDNTIPTVKFEPEQNSTPAKTQSTKVTVTDTNLNEGSLRYVWTTTNVQPQVAQITNTFTNGSSISLEAVTGNRYLWILALDKANNQVIEGSGPFLLDNTPPDFTLSNSGTTNSITVNVEGATDDYSGIDSYSYTIRQVSGSFTQTVTDGASHTFNSLTPGATYIISVTVTDGSGNAQTKSTDEITTSSIPSGSTALDIELVPSTGWTNGDVKVTITNNSQNVSGLHIEYKEGSTGTYETYTGEFTVSQNTTIYAKLVDNAGNEGSETSAQIANIDKKAPTISASPSSDSNYQQNKNITITATDEGSDSTNIAGFNASQSLEYGWSSSSTTPPSNYTSLTGTNTAGAKQITFSVPGNSTLNGQQYLWVQAGSVTDRANNSNLVAHFGPYYFDNTAPTLGGNGQITIEEKTSKSISISVPEVVDTGSGAPTSPQYSYYIKKSTDANYGEAKGTTAEQTFEFNDLDDNTNYDIQVTFADNAGNVGSAKTNAQTALVPALNSSNTKFKVTTQDGKELADGKVTNEAVKVEISVDSSTQANYTLQYRIGNTGNFTEYTGPITLNDKATVYARLWDERNDNENVGTATSKAINNIDTSLSDLGVIVTNKDPVPEDTKVTDSEDNPITIPEGFTPQPDPESDTPNEPKVEDGVVIKDEKGNEFVWIPVGTINLSKGGTATINYDRYAFSDWDKNGTDSTSYQAPIKTTSSESEYFSEALNSSEKNSAVSNHGFYLGRYEAGVSSTSARTASSGTSDAVIIQPNKNVYNFVTQSEARSLAEGMAGVEGYSGTTNLTSSYAWDTALRFLQATGNSSYLTNSSQGNYYNTSFGGTNSSTLMETGQTTAVQHLYDMGGNVYEWTTERYSNQEATKVSRGGFYGFTSTDEPVIGRFSSSNTADQAVGFRVAMFLGEVDDQVRYMDDLKVGDYVAYKPEGNQYYAVNLPQFTGYNGNGTIYQEDLAWRVLSINDDGTVDLISDTPLSYTIGFGGALGYNNSVFLMNDICSNLYRNNSLGATARSINLEDDIESKMNAAGIAVRDSYGRGQVYSYGNVRTYTNGRYYPYLYAQEIGSGIDTGVAREDGITKNNSYYNPPTYDSYAQAETSLTATSDYYSLGSSNASSYFNNSKLYDLLFNTSSNYWLASRSIMLNSTYVGFALRKVSNGDLSVSALYDSEQADHNYSDSNSLRPVVSLKSNIKLGSGDGSSASKAYQIIQ